MKKSLSLWMILIFTLALTACSADTTRNSKMETYRISAGGEYTLSDTITDTMVLVDAQDADVTLILNGATIQNSKGPAIYVRSADTVTITLQNGTKNIISDGASYDITDSDSTLDAAIFSKADLVIDGSGELEVKGNYKHGIVSKDDLDILDCTLQVSANHAAVCGKDSVEIYSGDITLVAGSDGIRSDNEEDAARGYVHIYDGTINIEAGNDGIQAATSINIENVDLTIVAGKGSDGTLTNSEESLKGLKAGADIEITGGTFDLNTRDDCIHSNSSIRLLGGTYTLSSGDDGVHADTDMTISGADTKLTINKSYEGIEATNIVISDGTFYIVASDDGINAAGGDNTSSQYGGRPGRGMFSGSTGSIEISGGDIYIKMSGDGIDSNGTLSMTGGSVIISGANRGDTAILDYETSGTISGGTFVGTGSLMMAQSFSASSEQGSIMVRAGGTEGTEITVADENGNVLISRIAEQDFSCVIISCPELVIGNTYTMTVGSASGEVTVTGATYGATNGMPNNPGGSRGMGGKR